MDSKNRKNDIYDVHCLQKKPAKTSGCIINTMPNFASREAIILDNNLVFNTGSTLDGVLFLSNRENIVQHLDSIPKPVLKKYKNNPMVAAMTMGGFLAADRGRAKIAFFAEMYDQSMFFERSNNSVYPINDHSYTYLPKFDVFGYGGSFALKPSADSRFAYQAPSSGKMHVYIPFSGKTNEDVEERELIEMRAFTNRIFVFDWSGQKQKELLLNYEVTNIAVNYKETVLFGVIYNKEMEASIVKASLK